jgi:hypothetical protein
MKHLRKRTARAYRRWRVIVFNEMDAKGCLALMRDGRPHEYVEQRNGRLWRTRRKVPFEWTRLGQHVEVTGSLNGDDLGPAPKHLPLCLDLLSGKELSAGPNDVASFCRASSDDLQTIIDVLKGS